MISFDWTGKFGKTYQIDHLKCVKGEESFWVITNIVTKITLWIIHWVTLEKLNDFLPIKMSTSTPSLNLQLFSGR